MHRSREALESNFLCPKCRNRGALVQEVQLGRSVVRMLPLSSARYVAASCTLCGYTEFYHQGILERCEEDGTQPVTNRLAEKVE